MSNSSQSTPVRGGARRPLSKAQDKLLSELEVQFGQFRAEHPPRTRIPAELRAAAVAASRRGIGAGELHRRCGISWSQLEAWKSGPQPGSKSLRKKAGPRAPESRDVRVFSVVDADPVAQPMAGAPRVTAEGGLELRLGRWSIRVQLADLTGGQ